MRISQFHFPADTATPEIYTLSLHDALPIWSGQCRAGSRGKTQFGFVRATRWNRNERSCDRHAVGPALRLGAAARSEEHTSELQSRRDLVCRLLLEKKKDPR